MIEKDKISIFLVPEGRIHPLKLSIFLLSINRIISLLKDSYVK